jgi:tRNA A-37 threonylcarbamoyl transferase component Bud32
MRATEETQRHLGERYVLTSQIGKGGMGIVWRADDSRLQRSVAIKEVRLPEELTGKDRDAVHARVLREARAAGRLNDPSAVTVYDVFQENGTAYIVMELVDAPTLGELVRSDGPLPEPAVAEIGLQVLGALERAHSEGILHRDVKPDNVMVTQDGRAKLADFGIASLKGDPKITATGVLLGSPSFMAPEQAQDDESGPPADLWALGATLYFAVEGEAPFDRGKPIPTLAAVVYDEPRPPRRAGALAEPIMALLSKSPAERPSPANLRRALEGVARSGDGRATTAALATSGGAPPVVPAPSRAPPATEAMGADARPALWDRESEPGPRRSAFAGAVTAPDRRRWPLVIGACLLVALAAAAFLLFLPQSDSPRGGPRERARAQADGGTDRPGQGQTESSEAPTTASGGDAPAAEALPAEDTTIEAPSGWTTYTDEDGWSIAHPPGWEVIPGPHDPTSSLDIREPGTGTYLRVDWGRNPGPSPQQAWLDYEPSFADAHDGYERIQMTPTTFQGYEASLWEYVYSDGGTELHAVNLGFVTDEYGFALNFQTHADDWEASADLFEFFTGSFRAPQ